MALPLVGAVTGAPGSAYWKFSGAARKRFGGRRVQELSPTAPSLGNRACSGLRHSLFDIANIARFARPCQAVRAKFFACGGEVAFCGRYVNRFVILSQYLVPPRAVNADI